MEIVFNRMYPNKNGYTFFMVTVWQENFSIPDVPFDFPTRVLEARLVIRGKIRRHVSEIANVDCDKDWQGILKTAKLLASKWEKVFRRLGGDQG